MKRNGWGELFLDEKSDVKKFEDAPRPRVLFTEEKRTRPFSRILSSTAFPPPSPPAKVGDDAPKKNKRGPDPAKRKGITGMWQN